jgi:hypothetical protein
MLIKISIIYLLVTLNGAFGGQLNGTYLKRYRIVHFIEQSVRKNENLNISVDLQADKPSNVAFVFFGASSIYAVPRELFTRFPNIQSLNLEYSKVFEIKKHTFLKATNLSLITLQSNNITKLEAGSFFGASSLDLINLSKNKISQIDVNAFRGLRKLSTLYLSNNLIENLNASSFSVLKNLSKIDLSNNKLVTLDQNLFQFNQRLKEIYLQGNKIVSLLKTMFSDLQINKLYFLKNTCINQNLENPKRNQIESALDTCNSNMIFTENAQIVNLKIRRVIGKVNRILNDFSRQLFEFMMNGGQ